MNNKNILPVYTKSFILIVFYCVISSSCKKELTVTSLQDQLLASLVFSNDATANAAVAGMYRSVKDNSFFVYTPGLLTALSGDECFNYFPDANLDPFTNNNILSNSSILPWSGWYNSIYQANSILENLQQSDGIPISSKNQYIGEAKFIRAFCYYYLVNLFGDVPLLKSTDVNISSIASRTLSKDIYAQIVADLQDAQISLVSNYSFSQGEHIRANKWVATAMLSRIFLYEGDWANAEKQATRLLDSGNYQLLSDLNGVFLKNNDEALLQWGNNAGEGNYEIATYYVTNPPNVCLSSLLLNAFESGDQRRMNWIDSADYQGSWYYFPNKYKDVGSTTEEYYTILRLAEQWLIRAEARLKQHNVDGALEDLNTIRARAGLNSLVQPVSEDSCLRAILHERQVELFTEWGQRWFDLKRTGTIDSVLSLEKPGIWHSDAKLYPIPVGDIQKDPNLQQNPGYN